MNGELGAVCDEFYISSRLFLKLDLPLERETVLHFFDRIRREYPGLRKMRRREQTAIILEEESNEQGGRRWIRLDSRSVRFGCFSPTTLEDFRRFGEMILTQAPYHLTLSELDFDHLELIYGFDLQYRGNHDQLVAETLFGENAATQFLFGDHAGTIIDAQPHFGISLSPECDLQAYLEVRSRTTTYEVRREAYENQPISIYLTTRKYWGVDPPASLADALGALFEVTNDLATEKVVPNFVNPLAAAIASRP